MFLQNKCHGGINIKWLALCFSGRAWNVIWVWNERARYKLLSSDICNFSSIRSSHSGGYLCQFVLGHFLNGKLKHKLKCCAQQERTAESESEASHLDSIDLDMLASCHRKNTFFSYCKLWRIKKHLFYDMTSIQKHYLM